MIHDTMNASGGRELVALAVIESLRELGFTVDLVVMEPTDWGRVEAILGRRVLPDRELPLLPFRVRAFSLYSRLFSFLKVAGSRGKYALTVNTHGELLPFHVDVTYVHYPTFALVDSGVSGKYSGSVFWRLYFEPFRLYQKWLAGRASRVGSLILANSSFTRDAIKRVLGRDAVVLYPPVPVEEFYYPEIDSREPLVFTTGRYAPEKRFEAVVKVASILPDVEFHVVGSVSGGVAKAYLEKLRRLADRLRVRNVHFHVNLPRRSLAGLYRRGMVYMHSMVNEHFGIAVVEAMAAGLVPVVHRSGGPWLDITQEGRYGIGYSTLEEAAWAVEKAISHYRHYARLALLRAKSFTWGIFKKKLKKILAFLLEAEKPAGEIVVGVDG